MFEVKVQNNSTTTSVSLIKDGVGLAVSLFDDSMQDFIDKAIKGYERYAVASTLGGDDLKVGVHLIRQSGYYLDLLLWQHTDGDYSWAMKCEATMENLEVLKQIASIAKFAEFNEQD